MVVLTRYPNGTFYSRSEKRYVSLTEVRSRAEAGEAFKMVDSTSFDDITDRYLVAQPGRATRVSTLQPCERCGLRVMATLEDTVCGPCDRKMMAEQKKVAKERLKAMPKRKCRACSRLITSPTRYFHCLICVPEHEMETADEFDGCMAPSRGLSGRRMGDVREAKAETARLRKLLDTKAGA